MDFELIRRGGRVVEGARLESVKGETLSWVRIHSLRHKIY